jgi:hypothetical protein
MEGSYFAFKFSTIMTLYDLVAEINALAYLSLGQSEIGGFHNIAIKHFNPLLTLYYSKLEHLSMAVNSPMI